MVVMLLLLVVIVPDPFTLLTLELLLSTDGRNGRCPYISP